MTKGERIAYALKKEVCRDSFSEWLETWEIDKEDFEKFVAAGKEAVKEDWQEEK